MYEDIIKKLTMICDNTKVDYICVIYKLSSVFEITGYEIIEYCGMKTTESLSIKIINKQKQITFSCDMNSLEDTLKEQITSLTDREDNPFITVPDHSIIKKAVKMGSDYTVDEIKELYNYIKNQIVEFMKQNKHIDDFKCENNNASSIQTQYIVIDNLGLQSIQTFNHASVDASIISPKYKKDCCCYPQIKNKTDCYKEIDIMLQRTFYDILDQLNPVAIPSGNYPCILGPEVTLNIIGHFKLL